MSKRTKQKLGDIVLLITPYITLLKIAWVVAWIKKRRPQKTPCVKMTGNQKHTYILT